MVTRWLETLLIHPCLLVPSNHFLLSPSYSTYPIAYLFVAPFQIRAPTTIVPRTDLTTADLLAEQPGLSTQPILDVQYHERVPIVVPHILLSLHRLVSRPSVSEDGILHRDTHALDPICLTGHRIRRPICALSGVREDGGG